MCTDDKIVTVKIHSLLTLVLTSCSHKIDTQGWADRVVLRMAGTNTYLASQEIKDCLRDLEQAVRDLGANKRIAVL